MNLDWITILKCPISGSDLVALSKDEISNINISISKKQLWLAGGVPVEHPLEAGLISRQKGYIYQIIRGVVILLKEQAISAEKYRAFDNVLNDDKLLVQNFYNEQGWFTNEDGNYTDAVIYEDLRDVSAEYLKKCHDRVSRFLKPSGTYMLDAASGALQYDDYLQYSANYTYRVCVDFSFQALSEARKKLGDKGIYVLADMTNMPFKDNVMGGFVSLNTIYHIPKDEQVQAINELYRVLAKGAKGVVVYDWYKHSPWMNIALLPFRSVVYIKNRILSLIGKLINKKPHKRLYFYAHTQYFFRHSLPPYKLMVWRTLSVPFMRYYIHSWLFGKQILRWIYAKEEQNPELYGTKGEYPMLVFEK